VTTPERFAIDPPLVRIPWAVAGMSNSEQSQEVTFSSSWTIAGLGCHRPT